MTRQYINLGEHDWEVLIYYDVTPKHFVEIRDALEGLKCPNKDIEDALDVLRHKNTGFTFTNSEYKMSMVCIGRATCIPQFVSTIIHESKHVQSHICSYYEVSEKSETAAYLIGYLAHEMYKLLAKL